MTKLRKFFTASTFTLTALSGLYSQTAAALTETVSVEVNFPSILIFYSYTDLDLTVTAAGLAGLLGVSSSACTSGDYCENTAGSLVDAAVDISSGSATVTGDIATDSAALSATSAAITVTNAYGMRCLGCSSYSVAVADGGANLAIQSPTVSAATPAATGLTMVTGNLGFTIDLTQVDDAAETETFVYTVTATP